jgi:hypothetical protein
MNNIVEAIKDRNLFGSLFKNLSTWKNWLACLKAIFALPMDEDELTLYRQCTGRNNPPKISFKEIYLIVGRRGGKSFIVALIAVFLSIFKDHSKHLSPGERGVVVIIATDRKQCQIILRYVKAILNLKIFKSYVQSEKAESIELNSGIDIQVSTCSYRTVRGFTVVAAILEESAFWRIEGANPDREIYVALRPAMSTIPDSMLISISTPYSKQGLLYEAHKEYFGKDESDEVLVWQAPSIVMNPTLSERMIDKELQKDLSAGRAEWLAQFREDIESFLALEVIERVVISGRLELPYVEGVKYFAFTDPSGGGADSFTLSIGHRESGKLVQDVLKARRGDPHQTVKDYAETLKKYHIREVTGDRYAGSWVSGAFRKESIIYRVSELNKSELYLEALPHFNPGLIELLDNRDVVKQLRSLERRRGSSGKDTVDHPKEGHDDSANVTCGLIATMGQNKSCGSPIFFVGPPDFDKMTEEEKKARIERRRKEKESRAMDWFMARDLDQYDPNRGRGGLV